LVLVALDVGSLYLIGLNERHIHIDRSTDIINKNAKYVKTHFSH